MKESTIWIKNGVNPRDKYSQIGEEKIKHLWQITKETDDEVAVFQIKDLMADVKSSVVLSNAYRLCRNSAHVTSLNQQKFQSLVYLNENQQKLPR